MPKLRTWAGWVVFAGTMLSILGVINMFEGTVALYANERIVLTRNRFVVVDVTSWGWTLLITGVVLLAVGLGLLAARSWARWAAIVVLILHAVIQVAWLGAYPIW